MKKGNINVSVENIFPLIKKFLYSDHEIFLRELISNATDATLKLNHIASIGKEKIDVGDPLIEVKVDKKAKKLHIIDQGIGMTAAVRKRIFDKFYRESSGNIHNVKGHGLGLAYVKQIIKMHSGTISVSSAPNQGSTFTVFLPF